MNVIVIAEFDARAEAQRAAEAVLRTGLGQDAISLVSPGPAGMDTDDPNLVVKDAEKGALVGGLAGLLLGLTELSVPGIGPVLAGGWIVTTLLGTGIGAAAGGVAGAFMEKGLSADTAHSLAEALHKGRTVLTIRTDDGHLNSVLDLLDTFNLRKIHHHRQPAAFVQPAHV